MGVTWGIGGAKIRNLISEPMNPKIFMFIAESVILTQFFVEPQLEAVLLRSEVLKSGVDKVVKRR